MLKLEQENLIEANKGVTIKSFSLEEIINYLEIRETLEGLIARTAASNMTEEKLALLEDLVKQMKSHLENQQFDEYSNCNQAFHAIIYESSTNQQAVEMVNKIKTQLKRLQIKTILVPGRTQESLKEHQKILNAMQSHDEKWAEDAIKHHVAQVRKAIAENYAFLS